MSDLSHTSYPYPEDDTFSMESNPMLDGQQPYENVRGDNYSDESSRAHSQIHVDPTATNYNRIKRVNPDTHRITTIKVFPTGSVPGSIIKNAATGTYQTLDGYKFFRTGCFDEDLFFSSRWTASVIGPENTLYYDNPEQMERHLWLKIPTSVKDAWAAKKTRALNRLNKQVQSRVSGGNVMVR